MKRYLALVRTMYRVGGAYRFTMLFTLASNIFYIVVIYFLWRSIYRHSETIRGMTFEQVFVYMALAGSLFVMFKTYADWEISYQIIQGDITSNLLIPLDFQLNMLSRSAGFMLFNATLITLPSILVIIVFFPPSIAFDVNILFFLISVGLAFLLSFLFDYITGVTSFYTESIWGISTSKEMFILILSGGLIPLRFFPENLQAILRFLPFQAMYNVPLTILVDTSLTMPDYGTIIGVQVVWTIILVIISRLFFAQASKALTVNGG